MQFNVSETKKILKEKLGSLYERAEIIFNYYREKLPFDVTNVLMHAADQGEEKIKEVLALLEEHKKYLGSLKKHLNKNLEYQHPDIRGRRHEIIGFSKTQEMFSDICKRVLGLGPTKEQEVPNEPFIVRTQNSVYRFGKVDNEGKRSVSRDKKPLDFSLCKIKEIIIGYPMVLDHFKEGWELTTSSIKSIEVIS